MKYADSQEQICCLHTEDGNAHGPEMMPLVCCGEDVKNKLEQTERCFKLHPSSRGLSFGRSLLHLLLVPSGISAVLSRAVVWLHLPTMLWWFAVSSFQNTTHHILVTISIQLADSVCTVDPTSLLHLCPSLSTLLERDGIAH